MFFISKFTPPFDALYTEAASLADSRPWTEEIVTIEPFPCFIIWGRTDAQLKNVPVRFTAITLFQCLSLTSCTLPPPIADSSVVAIQQHENAIEHVKGEWF
jgi:hypothetical protein